MHREPYPLADKGILSLVVRTHSQSPMFSTVTGWVASPVDVEELLPPYLTGLLLSPSCWRCLAPSSASATARWRPARPSRPPRRLRRAVYHHTFRLGTLAFRALGPSEAVSIFTRHVEAVHDALYAWLTVSFREPIKFVLAACSSPWWCSFWLALAFLLFAVSSGWWAARSPPTSASQGRRRRNQAARAADADPREPDAHAAGEVST